MKRFAPETESRSCELIGIYKLYYLFLQPFILEGRKYF